MQNPNHIFDPPFSHSICISISYLDNKLIYLTFAVQSQLFPFLGQERKALCIPV